MQKLFPGASGGDSKEWKEPEATAMLGYIYAQSGRKQEVEQIRERLRSVPRVDPYAMVAVNVTLDNRDDAFAWLEQAYSIRGSRI